jgi:transposase-like protein
LRELESGKSMAQVCRENDIHPTLAIRWKIEYNENPETAFRGKGNICNADARVAEWNGLSANCMPRLLF